MSKKYIVTLAAFVIVLLGFAVIKYSSFVNSKNRDFSVVEAQSPNSFPSPQDAGVNYYFEIEAMKGKQFAVSTFKMIEEKDPSTGKFNGKLTVLFSENENITDMNDLMNLFAQDKLGVVTLLSTEKQINPTQYPWQLRFEKLSSLVNTINGGANMRNELEFGFNGYKLEKLPN